MPKVFVVILNWNGWKDTIACLKSIEKAEDRGMELNVVIVDNASTNESVSKIENEIKGKKGYSLIANQTNLGFAGGNNIGIRFSLNNGADYLCILNNDTEVSKRLFTDLLSFMSSHKNAGAVSPKIYFYKGYEFHKDRYEKKDLGKVIWYAGGTLDWNNVYGSNSDVDAVDSSNIQDHQTDFVTGACMFLSSNVLKTVGLFDEKYFLYLEDTDLSMRIKKSGYELWFAKDPYLWHKVSQSSSIGSQLNDYFITRNRLRFGFKYASLRAKLALVRESIRFLLNGRKWQRIGSVDFYLQRFGKGSWGN